MGRLGKTQHFSCLSVEFLPSTLSKKWASWDPASFLRALMSRANAKNQLCTRCGAKPSLSLLFLQLQCLYGLWALLSQIFSHQHSWKYNELKSRCMFRKKLAKKKILLTLILKSLSSEREVSDASVEIEVLRQSIK